MLVLAYTNAAVDGTYMYALTERWSLGVNAGGYSNRYEGVENGGTLPNNHGYYVGGDVEVRLFGPHAVHLRGGVFLLLEQTSPAASR